MACTFIAPQIILTHRPYEFTQSRFYQAAKLTTREIIRMGLDDLRERLDSIDTQMMLLLSERAKIITQVADFKRQHKIPIYVPEREAAIMARLRTLNPGPLPGDTVERIYRTIVEEMRNFEGAGAAP